MGFNTDDENDIAKSVWDGSFFKPTTTPRSAKPMANDADAVAATLDDEFEKLGYSDTARLSILGDVGRENNWDRKTIFNGHDDPKNKAYNRGIISWQGDRRQKLDNFLKQEGVLGRGDDEELRGMARFMHNELQNDYPDVYKKLTNAQSTYDASEALRQYIKYVPDAPYNTPDPDFRVKNNAEWARRAQKLGLAQFNPDKYASDIWNNSDADPDQVAADIWGSDSDKGSTQPSPTIPNQMPSQLAPQANAPVPELPVTLEAQRQAAHDPLSTRAAVMYTPGSQVPPKSENEMDFPLPDGSVLRADSTKFQQYWERNPTAMEDIIAGKSDHVLKLIGGKAQRIDGPSGVGVVTRDAQGNELVSSAVDNINAIPQEIALQQKQFPNQQTVTQIENSKDITDKRVPLDNQAQRQQVLTGAQPGEQPTDTMLRQQFEGSDYGQWLKYGNQPDTPENRTEFNRIMQGNVDSINAENRKAVADYNAKLPKRQQAQGSQQQQAAPNATAAPSDGLRDSVVNVKLEQKQGGYYAEENNRQIAAALANELGVPMASALAVVKANPYTFADDKGGNVTEEYLAEQAKTGRPNRVMVSADLKRKVLEHAKVVKQREEELTQKIDQYKSELQPNEPTSLASIRAAFDMGLMEPNEFLQKVEKEKDLARRLKAEAVGYETTSTAIPGIDDPKQVPARRKEREDEYINAILQDYPTLADYEDEQKRLKEEYKYRGLAHPIEFAKSFYGAVPKAVASMLKAADIAMSVGPLELGRKWANGQDPAAVNESVLSDLGNRIDSYIDSTKNKDLAKNFWVTVLPDTLGQLATQIAAGVITGGAALPTAIGASMGAAAQYDEAKKYGANDRQKLASALVGALAAVPDALLFTKWFNAAGAAEKAGFLQKLTQSLKARLGVKFGDKAAEEVTRDAMLTFTKNIVKGSLGEGLQEVSENKINDWMAGVHKIGDTQVSAGYDPSPAREKKLYSINDEDIVSFLGGLIGGAAGGAIETVSEDIPEIAQAEFYDKAKAELERMLAAGEVKPEVAEEVKQTIERQQQQAQPKPAKAAKPLTRKDTVEPGTPVTIEGKGEGVIVEDKGNSVVVDHTPQPGKDGETKYSGRATVKKTKVTPIVEAQNVPESETQTTEPLTDEKQTVPSQPTQMGEKPLVSDQPAKSETSKPKVEAEPQPERQLAVQGIQLSKKGSEPKVNQETAKDTLEPETTPATKPRKAKDTRTDEEVEAQLTADLMELRGWTREQAEDYGKRGNQRTRALADEIHDQLEEKRLSDAGLELNKEIPRIALADHITVNDVKMEVTANGEVKIVYPSRDGEIDVFPERRFKTVSEAKTFFKDQKAKAKATAANPSTSDLFDKVLNKQREEEAAKAAPDKKEPWQMTQDELVAAMPPEGEEGIRKSGHKRVVTQALLNGDPVPPNVLAEYPEFQGKPTTVKGTDGLDLRIRKVPHLRGSGGLTWQIFESTSGITLGQGSTQQKALDDAEKIARLRGRDLLFKDFGLSTEDTKKPAPFSNTQLEFSKEQSKPFEDFRKNVIDPNDVVEKDKLPSYANDGLNIEPHVTIKYGLRSNDPADVQNLFDGEKPIELELGKTSVFPGAEKGNYDVVIAEVKSPALHKLNDKITQGADVEPSVHPEYKPHVTIAYVKKGTGQKYAGRTDFEGQKYTFDGVTFSPADKSGKTKIPLGGPTDITKAFENAVDTDAINNLTPEELNQVAAMFDKPKGESEQKGQPQYVRLENSLDIPRSEMPQIGRRHMEDFIKHVEDRGSTVTPDRVKASDLLPTQNEYNPAQAAQLPEEALNKPILISSDNRVLDGHNTLMRLQQEDPDRMVNVRRIDLPALEAIGMMRTFKYVNYKPVGHVGTSDQLVRTHPDQDIVSPIDRQASQEEKTRQLQALTEENKPIVEKILAKFRELGLTHADPLGKNNEKKFDEIINKANRPEVKAKKPWFDVEHIRDAFRFRAGFNTFEDIPKMAQIIKDAGIEFVKVDTDKFLDGGLWGWRPVALDLRMPNGQLVEFYASFPEMIDAQYSTSEDHPIGNHTLFENWRNRDKAYLEAHKAEYDADAAESKRWYDAAYQAALDRVGFKNGADIEASFIKAAASLGSVTDTKSSMSSSAEGMSNLQTPSADRIMDGNPSTLNTNADLSERPLPTDTENTTSKPSVAPNAEAKQENKTLTKPFAGSFEEYIKARQDAADGLPKADLSNQAHERVKNDPDFLPYPQKSLKAGDKYVNRKTGREIYLVKPDSKRGGTTYSDRKDGEALGDIALIAFNEQYRKSKDAGETATSSAPNSTDLFDKVLTNLYNEESGEKTDKKEKDPFDDIGDIMGFEPPNKSALEQEHPFFQSKYDQLKPAFDKALKSIEAADPEAQMDGFVRKLHERFTLDQIAQLKPYVVRFIDENPLQSAANESIEEVDADGSTTTDQPGERSEKNGQVSDTSGTEGSELLENADTGVSSEPGESSTESGADQTGGVLPDVQQSDRPGDESVGGETDGGAAGDLSTRGGKRGSSKRNPKKSTTGDSKRVVGTTGNFYVNDVESFAAGGLKTKFRNNVAAIETLRKIQAEGRSTATPEEQAILAKYIGWGQFPALFNTYNEKGNDWSKEREQLLSLISKEEFESASASTKNAHYTAPQIVKTVWDIVEKLGFKGGNVLETSLGIGNFLYLMPNTLRGTSRVTGIELDKLTAQIAKLLFPSYDIRQMGYQEFRPPKGFYDLAISNVPFGSYMVNDPKMPHFLKSRIHNYFFAKAVDDVRPGGLVAFITSTGTMTAPDVLKYLEGKADLITAVRFPADTFLKDAGTSVVTDLVVLRVKNPQAAQNALDDVKLYEKVIEDDNARINEIEQQLKDLPKNSDERGPLELKRANLQLHREDVSAKLTDARQRLQEAERFSKNRWTELTQVPDPDGGEAIPLNQYYADNPKNILGRLDRKGTMYRGNSENVSRTPDFEDKLKLAIAAMPKDVVLERESELAEQPELEAAPSSMRQGSLTVKDGKVFSREGSFLVERPMPQKQIKNVTQALKVRDALNTVAELERTGNKAEAEEARKTLNEEYDAYVKEFGTLHENRKAFEVDPDHYRLLALENYDKKTKKVTGKADVFTKPTVSALERADTAASYSDAMNIVLNQSGFVDVKEIGRLMGVNPDEAGAALLKEGLAYNDPRDGWTVKDLYLSGEVRRKLREAKEAAILDPAFEPNVTALEKVQPDDLPYRKIEPTLGAAWIPASDIKQFMADMMKEVGVSNVKPEEFEVTRLATGDWIVNIKDDNLRKSAASTELLGTAERNFADIISAAIRDVPIVIKKSVGSGSEKTTFTDKKASARANRKVKEIRGKFKRWVWADDARRERLHRAFNDTYNDTTETKWNGSHLTFPGMNPLWVGRLYSHIKHAVYRLITQGRLLAAHEVGTGKTNVMIASAMELRRLKLAKKPAIICLNANVEQVAETARELYPGARVLAAYQGMDADLRKQTATRIMSGDWDIVIMTHENLQKIPMSRERQLAFINEELQYLRDQVAAANAADEQEKANTDSYYRRRQSKNTDNRVVKALEAKIATREAKLKELFAKPKDDAITFEETGIDFLMVDEAHAFKNLDIYTTRQQTKGIPTSDAQRATNMFLVTRYLADTHNNRGVAFFTGTPISNTTAEAFNMMRYLMYNDLKARGIENFDAWAANYGENITTQEMSATGELKPVTAFRRFKNLETLSSMLRSVMDVVWADDIADIKRPNRQDEVLTTPMSDAQKEYQMQLVARAEALKTMTKSERMQKGADNWLALGTDAKKMAIDMRLVDPDAADDPNSKTNVMVNKILELHKERPDQVQLIFSDIGVNGTKANPKFSLYQDIINKLVKGGIPRNKIIDFSKFTSGKKVNEEEDTGDSPGKEEAMRRLNSGEALIAIGSAQKLGTGVNVQQKVMAMHKLDVKQRPDQDEQETGRGWRGGNENETVKLFRYTTQDSFDMHFYSTLQQKANFIRQLLRGEVSGTFVDSIDDSLDYDTVVAVTASNPLIRERIDTIRELSELEDEYEGFRENELRVRDRIARVKRDIETTKRVKADMAENREAAEKQKDNQTVTIDGYGDFEIENRAARLERQAELNEIEAEVKQAFGTPETDEQEEQMKAEIERRQNALEPLQFQKANKALINRIKQIKDSFNNFNERHKVLYRNEGRVELGKMYGFPLYAQFAAVKDSNDVTTKVFVELPATTYSSLGFASDKGIEVPLGSATTSVADDLSKIRKSQGHEDRLQKEIENMTDEIPRLEAGLAENFEDLPKLTQLRQKLARIEIELGGAIIPEGYQDVSDRLSDLDEPGAMETLKEDQAPLQTGSIGSIGKFVTNDFVFMLGEDLPETEGAVPDYRLDGIAKRLKSAEAFVKENIDRPGAKVNPVAVDTEKDYVIFDNRQQVDVQYFADLAKKYPNAEYLPQGESILVTDKGKLVGMMAPTKSLAEIGEDLMPALRKAKYIGERKTELRQAEQAKNAAKAQEARDAISQVMELGPKTRQFDTPDMAEPYGLKSALPQTDQTETPEFKKWFKDSKVVDKNGKPLVVYHGTFHDFETFKKAYEGIFFSPSPKIASGYAKLARGSENDGSGGNVLPVYLSLQNPYIYDFEGEESYDFFNEAEEARAAGHDGMILLNVRDSSRKPETQYAVFDSTQIKSAIGNNGNFDPNDPNISKSALSRKLDENNIDDSDRMTVDEMKALAYEDFDTLLDGRANVEVVNGNIKANAASHEIYRRALEYIRIKSGKTRLGAKDFEDLFTGVFLKPDVVQDIVAGLTEKRDEAKSLGYSADQIKVFDDHIKALEESAQAGHGTAVIYVLDRALPHELFHRADFMGAMNKSLLNRHTKAASAILDTHKVTSILKVKHFSKFNQFGQLSDAMRDAWIRSEIPPLLLELSEQELLDQYGITPEMAADYMLNWFEGYVAKNGLESLDNFDREEINVQQFIKQIHQAYADQNGQTRQGNEGGTQRQEREPERETSSDTQGNGKRPKEFESGIDTSQYKLRSLPQTMRAAGIDAIDEAYEVFHDEAATEEAARLLEENGIEGSIQLLRDLPAKAQDAQHAILSFMLIKALQNHAYAIASTDPTTANLHYELSLKLAREHAIKATQAGRFTRMPSVIGPTLEHLTYAVQGVIQEKYGDDKTLNAEEREKWEALGRQLEEAHAQVTALKKEKRNLKAQVKRLQDEKEGRKQRRSKGAAKSRARLVQLVKDEKQKTVDAIRERLRKQFGEPVQMSALEQTGLFEAKETEPVQKSALPEDFPIDDFAEVGAMYLTEGLAGETDYLPHHFQAQMVAEFGDSIVPYFQKIYERSWAKRNEWLDEIRWQQTKERIENKYNEGNELEDWEVEEILGEQKNKAKRRRAIENYHRMSAGGRSMNRDLDDMKRLISEIAPNTDDAIGAMLHAEKVNASEMYRRLQELGIENEKDQREAIRNGKEIYDKAKIELQGEKNQIANELLDAENQLKTIDDLRWEARNKMNKAQQSVADEMKRIKRGELSYRAGQIVDIANAMRTMMASLDMSGALRQGGWFTFANPKLQQQAFVNMFKSLGEKGYGRVIMDIENNGLFTLAQRSGIDFAMAGKGEDSTLMGEELFKGEQLIEKIPLLGWLAAEGVVKPSERTYTSFLDTQRMVMFEVFARELFDQGMTFQKNRPQFEQIAKFINVATGRGTIPQGRLGQILMQLPLFAPRYTLSRFQLLNMTLNPVAYYNMPAGTRKIVAKSAGSFYGKVGLVLGILGALGVVGWDSDDDDFLKINVGNSKYDILVGLQPILKLMTKVIRSAYRTKLGFDNRLPGEFATDVRTAAERFARGKLAPVTSLLADTLWYGEDYVGNKIDATNPLDWGKAIGQRLVPLTISDAVQAGMTDGWTGPLKTTPFAFFGVGVSTYKKRLEQPETEAEKLAAKAAGWNFKGSKKDKAAIDLKNELVARSRMGEDVSAAVADGIAKGLLSESDQRAIAGAAKKTLLEDKAEGLSLDYLEEVMKAATPTERAVLLPLLNKKMKNADVDGKLDAPTRKRLEDLGGHIVGDVPMPDTVKSEFEKLGIKTPDVSESLTLKKGGPKVKMTPAQYEKYRSETLERIYKQADELTKSKEYKDASPEQQTKMLETVIRKQRTAEQKETKKELAQ